MWTTIVLVLIAVFAVALLASFTHSPGRRHREENYDPRLGPFG